jgi:hypothetical protein
MLECEKGMRVCRSVWWGQRESSGSTSSEQLINCQVQPLTGIQPASHPAPAREWGVNRKVYHLTRI